MKLFLIFKLNHFQINKEDPVFFIKPETSILINNKPFYYPDFTTKIIAQPGLVFKTIKAGKYIQERFGIKYFSEFAFGLNFIALDVLNHCILNNKPWEIATSFNDSFPLSKFSSINNCFSNNFDYIINNNIQITKTDISKLFINPEKALSYISKFIMIKTGDLLFIPFSIPEFNVNIGDFIEISLNSKIILQCKIK